MAAAVVNTVSAFQILELTGPNPSTVQLRGRALPYRPFHLRGTQRVEFTWLPGYAEATATVLGPSEEPTEITGWWKNKYLDTSADTAGGLSGADPVFSFTLNGRPIRTAREAAKTIDAIRRRGQLLEVTWDEVTRHGHLVEFEQRWHNTHDLEYSIKFAWTSQGERTAPGVFTVENSLAGTLPRMRRLKDDFDNLLSEPPFGLNTDLLGKLLQLSQKFSDSFDKLQGAITNAVSLVLTPLSAVHMAWSALQGMVGALNDIRDALEAQTAAATRFRPTPAQMSAGQKRQAEMFISDLKRAARSLRNEAVERRDFYAAQVSAAGSNLLAVYTAKEGDDLRDVSRLFYGTPLEWRTLLRFNNLTSAELEPGQVVLVPKLPLGQGAGA